MIAAESTAQLERLFGQMALIRAFDTSIASLYAEGFIRGSAHPYVGMEAIAVGACSALEADDFITSTHRGHGHCLARGLDPSKMMAEILGRESGYCRGKGGSMHITDLEHGMLGADGIVGGSHGIAVGAAYGRRILGGRSVVLCFFGDGAANEGSFHEALNLASVLRAPVVFICENNEWALTTPAASTKNIADIADRAASYGIPGRVVDGNDVLEVREVVVSAVNRARGGEGPTLVEAKSYRMTSHSVFATGATSSEAELEVWRGRDPLLRFRTHLVELGVESSKLEEIIETAAREVEYAIEFAKAAATPDPSTALTEIYAPADWNTPGRLS